MNPEEQNTSVIGVDAFLPAEMAAKAEETGVKKAVTGWRNTFALGILAGPS